MQPVEIKLKDCSDENLPQTIFAATVEHSFRVGRQAESEPADIGFSPCNTSSTEIQHKLIIAPATERRYSRNTLDVRFENGEIFVHNMSNQSILVGTVTLPPSQETSVESPCEIAFGKMKLAVGASNNSLPNGLLQSLSAAMRPPNLERQYNATVSLNQVAQEGQIDGRQLMEFLKTTLQIFQDSPDSSRFFEDTAEAMIDLLDLDHVMIALSDQFTDELSFKQCADPIADRWHRQAVAQRAGIDNSSWYPSSHVLRKVEEEKATAYLIPEIETASLAEVRCLVASPLLNANNEMVGFIYGDRTLGRVTYHRISETEAKFVELFANGISTGLERLVQQRRLSEMRARFDQFFTPELARRLESDPTLLEPQSANVSILFADIRGFSRIAERIGADQTIAWVNAVMNELSACVLQHAGVVVDYIGDEILAMWGAPDHDENHAERATQAALEMQRRIPELNKTWEGILGEPLEVGIGINSGEAQVGNIGSDKKFKYGPLGDVVNVASRVQSATRQLGVSFLVTESTVNQLTTTKSRKIRTVRFVNVQRPIGVFVVADSPNSDWLAITDGYEDALQAFERRNYETALAKLNELVIKAPGDTASQDLLMTCQAANSASDPVWTLDSK